MSRTLSRARTKRPTIAPSLRFRGGTAFFRKRGWAGAGRAGGPRFRLGEPLRELPGAPQPVRAREVGESRLTTPVGDIEDPDVPLEHPKRREGRLGAGHAARGT